MKTIKPNEIYFNTGSCEIEGTIDADDLSPADREYLQAEPGGLLDLFGEVFLDRNGEIDLISTQVSNLKRHVGIELDSGSVDYILTCLLEVPKHEDWQDDYYYDGNE